MSFCVRIKIQFKSLANNIQLFFYFPKNPQLIVIPFRCLSYTFPIPFPYSPHTLLILSSYSPHTLLILSSYSLHTLFIHSSYTPHTLLILSSRVFRHLGRQKTIMQTGEGLFQSATKNQRMVSVAASRIAHYVFIF